MGGAPDRFQECPQGSRFLYGCVAARGVWLHPHTLGNGSRPRRDPDCIRDAAAGRYGESEGEGEIYFDPLEEQSHQFAVRRALLPVRCARCLVCRWRTDLSLRSDRLELYEVGSFMAAWVIGYGGVQAFAPKIVNRSADGQSSEIRAAQWWAFVLAGLPVAIAGLVEAGVAPVVSVVVGLALFGIAFAVNSAVHSYLILSFSDSDKVALNVGFYYMANAGGRLVGCLFSGLSYQMWGLSGCLLTASVMVLAAGAITIVLAGEQRGRARSEA